MSTIKAGSISKGMYLLFRNEPWQVTRSDFFHPGKGSAVQRVKLKNVKTGNTQDITYKTSESVEMIEVNSSEMQFLYNDGSDVVFMDPRSYEQVSVPLSLIEDKVGYLTPEVSCYVITYEDEVLGVSLPPKVKLKVEYAEDAVAGNRVNAPKKPVKMETGIEVMAPLFVKTGETLIIDTETGQYVSRG